jgi:3-oxoacyl-[acyl-carrier protein] reductase
MPTVPSDVTHSSRLNGRRALITGAARGIGQAIAQAFAEEGARVMIADLDASLAQSVASDLAGGGSDAIGVGLDVASRESVDRVIAQALRDFGGLDVLVNNAGVCEEKSCVDISDDDWDRIVDVNLRGTFLCCRAVLPHFVSRGRGRIINIASQLALSGGSRMVHYTASKAGVIGLTKALAREYAPHGVLVNAIAPGPVDTRMTANNSAEWRAERIAALPIGRFAEPGEIAPTAVFLASDESSYYIGQVLGPNGGDVIA